MFVFREPASGDRSPRGPAGRSGRTRPRCAGVHQHARRQVPGASRAAELRDILVGALTAPHTGVKRVWRRLEVDRRRLGGSLGLTEAYLAPRRISLATWRRAHCHLMLQSGYAIKVGPLPRYPGRRLRDLGSWLRELGTRLRELGARLCELGARLRELGARLSDLGLELSEGRRREKHKEEDCEPGR